VLGVQVITSNRGLLPAETEVTAGELRAFAETEIRPDEPRYRDPLLRDLASIDGAAMAGAAPPEIVLLGSIATGKYVDVLLDVLGERLLFPSEFVGRGDMSRGALLLRAAREGRELACQPAATTVRRGRRPRKAASDDGDGTDTPLLTHTRRR
jgi:Cdc6-related protein, AAA superfamily ATPase